MVKRTKKVPPLCRPGRKVTLTLTKGQEKAILESTAFQLVGESYSGTVRFWMVRGIEESMIARRKQ